ncbi:MAG: extracellular solute-binding protein [Parvibaculaceae bacterium]
MMPIRCILALILALVASVPALATPVHGIAMHGEPALPPDFDHLPYVNPDAPKGGVLREAIAGSFDSLNPFIVRGQPPSGVRTYVFESLMARNRDEPFSLYGLIARTIEVAPDRSWVTFHLDERARFSDGVPITTADVRFSLETLRDEGRPNFQTYYRKVERIETPDDRTVTFHLAGGDRELVLILGLMPILPRHFFADRKFDQATLNPLVGSGPYTIASIEPGKRIVYRRNPDYWARDLPISRGLWNVDEIRSDYYRDNLGAFEAFKKGLADVRGEQDPVRWSSSYDFEAVKQGQVVLETVPSGLPAMLRALAFNTRHPVFADIRVRDALIHAFDFEWANKNLFRGLFVRTQGYFAGSELSSVGHPATSGERQLLAQYGARLEEPFLDGSYRLPMSDGSGRDRANLRRAMDLLNQAGWTLKDGKLVNAAGQPMQFEMLAQGVSHEQIGLHLQRSLASIGITLTLRRVDSAELQRRLQTYDFDMVPVTWQNSLSPGNEQSFYWGSAGREVKGTRNYPGIADKAVDGMITEILKAESDEDFVAAVRALDRLLIAGRYVIPLYDAPGQWIARWTRIAAPPRPSLSGFELPATWLAGP